MNNMREKKFNKFCLISFSGCYVKGCVGKTNNCKVYILFYGLIVIYTV